MPTRLFIIVFCFLFASSAFATETVKQREQREAVNTQLEARLRDANQKLAALMGKVPTFKEDTTRRQYEQQLNELHKSQETATRKISALKAANGLDWDRLKAETNAAIDDLNRIHDSMASLFKSI